MTRRRSRECALQILYQMDLNKQLPEDYDASTVEAAVVDYWQSFDKDIPVDREFAERLVHGVSRQLQETDAAIGGAAKNWRLARMEAVDRALLRVGAYEILFCADVPRGVSINEAVEIAKRFSGNESASFINGILDQLAPEGS